MTAIEGAPPWVIAYEQARGLHPHSDLRQLGDYAWASFQAGDVDLGRQLFQHGVEVAQFPSPKSDLLVSLLAMQIGSHHYGEAATDERRPRAIPPAMLDQWLLGKAYVAALHGDAGAAQAWFAESASLGGSDPLEWDDLYARNLMALIHFRQGDTQRAMVLQESIATSIAAGSSEDWHLRYLNAINMARLHRAARRYEEADTISL